MTAMRFSVNVPVLSRQMAGTQLERFNGVQSLSDQDALAPQLPHAQRERGRGYRGQPFGHGGDGKRYRGLEHFKPPVPAY